MSSEDQLPENVPDLIEHPDLISSYEVLAEELQDPEFRAAWKASIVAEATMDLQHELALLADFLRDLLKADPSLALALEIYPDFEDAYGKGPTLPLGGLVPLVIPDTFGPDD